MIIYHNPRCSKSRATLQIIQNKKAVVQVIEYLKHPLSVAELKDVLRKLEMKAEDIVRKSEPLYKEKYKDKQLTEEQWLKVLAENPVLIGRPIVVKGSKAVLGRPPENVLKLI